MSEEDDRLPRLLSGRYRLEATLGQGGMGVVYRGTDLMMQRSIAVKLVRAVDGVQLDEKIAGRFLREAKNTARLQHEHIIEVFDLGRTEEGGLYFVMELLEGESLSARLRREGHLSPEKAVHIARQVCEGLEVAHTAGVVHRDLKPANIMLLSRAGDDDYVKVLDFGVSKSTTGDPETQLTHTGMLVGTVDYMAPEQIMGKPVDGRTDVYALGIVLYKMLSGVAPFRDAGVPAVIHAHLNTMPKPLIEVKKGVPNELDHVVLRCLMKSPDRRFESMAELSRALTAAVLPESASLIDLALGYGAGKADHDVYEGDDGDKTAVGVLMKGPPAGAGTPTTATRTEKRSLHAPLPADDVTVNEAFDDATVKMDRPLRPITGAGLPAAPLPGAGLPATARNVMRAPHHTAVSSIPGAPPAGVQPGHPLAGPMYPEDLSTSKRPVPDELRRPAEARPCAMCQTVNAPHVRSCVACGMSLTTENRDALNARMVAGPPRTANMPAPHMPAPQADAMTPRGRAVTQHPSGPFMPPSPMHGGPSMQWHPHQAPPPPPPPPLSMWQRFLTWTGLRSR
jgi:serine/threonine-protein kinase